MKVNVILTGLRGTGKSSVGKVLAQRLDFTFVDTDALIEELAGSRIAARPFDERLYLGWIIFGLYWAPAHALDSIPRKALGP